MINIKNLCFDYDQDSKQNILDNINLEIKSGELIAVMGSNGSGKSTFARLLNYLLEKKSGIIITDNLDYDDHKNIYKIRTKVGMVFQNPDNQIVSDIICEDVAFGPENLNLSEKEINTRVEDALKMVDMLEYKNTLVSDLSGGQKQKIAIAGILAMNPDYVIFDESTSMISNKSEILKQIFDLNKIYHKTIIFITHDIEEAIRFDRIIILDKSKIICDDTPENIFYNANKQTQDLILEANLDLPFSIKFINELQKFEIEIKNTLDIDKLSDLIIEETKLLD